MVYIKIHKQNCTFAYEIYMLVQSYLDISCPCSDMLPVFIAI